MTEKFTCELNLNWTQLRQRDESGHRILESSVNFRYVYYYWLISASKLPMDLITKVTFFTLPIL